VSTHDKLQNFWTQLGRGLAPPELFAAELASGWADLLAERDALPHVPRYEPGAVVEVSAPVAGSDLRLVIRKATGATDDRAFVLLVDISARGFRNTGYLHIGTGPGSCTSLRPGHWAGAEIAEFAARLRSFFDGAGAGRKRTAIQETP
jgi:hypothetical protein